MPHEKLTPVTRNKSIRFGDHEASVEVSSENIGSPIEPGVSYALADQVTDVWCSNMLACKVGLRRCYERRIRVDFLSSSYPPFNILFEIVASFPAQEREVVLVCL